MFERSGLVRIRSMMPVISPSAEGESEGLDTRPTPPSHWSSSCQHAVKRARLKRYATGSKARMQCVKCGAGVGNFIPSAGVFEAWDESLEGRVSSEREKVYEDYRRKFQDWCNQLQTRRDRRSDAWWTAYDKYLKTAVWQVKRQLVLERCSGVCEACGQSQATQVHHLSYPKILGTEPLWELRGVCVRCHEMIHPHMRGG